MEILNQKLEWRELALNLVSATHFNDLPSNSCFSLEQYSAASLPRNRRRKPYRAMRRLRVPGGWVGARRLLKSVTGVRLESLQKRSSAVGWR